MTGKNWSVRKNDAGETFLVKHDVSWDAKISTVEVPNDFDKEDTHVKFKIASEDDPLLLPLDNFKSENNEFSQIFFEHDFSSHDFVSCWKKAVGSFCEENDGSSEMESDSDGCEPPRQERKRKRREKDSVSGRKRAIIAWERNIRNGNDNYGVRFGGECWPPAFRCLVQEMRERIISETGKESDWDADDVAMLRKYYYLKHHIPPSNSSTIALHIKLAVMSPRCFAVAQELIAMYQGGELEKKKRTDGAAVTVRAGYFKFLYRLDSRVNEEEMYNVLKKAVEEKMRPKRVIHEKPIPKVSKADEKVKSLEDELKKVKTKVLEKSKYVDAITKENMDLKRKVSDLNKVLQTKDSEMASLKEELANAIQNRKRSEIDNKYLASSLASNTEELNKMKRVISSIRKENNQSGEGKRLREESSTAEAEIERLRCSHKEKAAELQKEKPKLKRSKVPSLSYNNQKDPNEGEKPDNEKAEDELDDNSINGEVTASIRPGDWVAVDYGTPTIYIGKVTKVDEESSCAEALFPGKIDGKKYKEKNNKNRSIDSFYLSQVISSPLELEFKKNGIIVLLNHDEIATIIKTKK